MSERATFERWDAEVDLEWHTGIDAEGPTMSPANQKARPGRAPCTAPAPWPHAKNGGARPVRHRAVVSDLASTVPPMIHTAKTLLVTDLDNTLWDWFEAWHASFSAMLKALEEATGLDQATLEGEIRCIHQARGTSEYSYLLNEVPSLIEAARPEKPMVAFDPALHRLYSERSRHTRLYDGVLQTLKTLKSQGVRVVAYTESVAYWTEWRIKHTGLDGVLDVLYSAPDHDLPSGVSVDDLRLRAPENYGLKHTSHRHVPRGAIKPNPSILRSILADMDTSPSQAVYVGDSLMKDIAMAQSVGVLDVHARYGEPQARTDYALLQRVSHWPDKDVTREQNLRRTNEVVPTLTIDGFAEILEIKGLQLV